MWNFQEVFLIMLSLFADLKLMNVLFIHETFLVYKLETFTNCKEVNHVMIMRSLINSWKLLSENPQFLPPLPEKIPPYFYSLPYEKLKKCKYSPPPLFANTENFSSPSCRKRGWGVEDTMLSLVRMVSFFTILI